MTQRFLSSKVPSALTLRSISTINTPMEILAIKWRRLGDSVLWTAALEALREWAPDATLDLAYPEPYRELFENQIPIRNHFALKPKLRENSKTIRQMRQNRYDICLGFHAHPRTRTLVKSMRARRKLIHHHSRKARRFGSDEKIVELGIPAPAIERDLNVVRTLGWNGPSPKPSLSVQEGTIAQAKAELQKLFGTPNYPLVIVNPFASRPAKQWPHERYLTVLKQLAPHAKTLVITENLAQVPAYYRPHYEKITALLETRSLSQLMGLLSQAQLYVGSDSGVKHLACAIGTRTLTLFGPESIAEWHGYDPKKHPTLQKDVLCRSNDPQPHRFAWCGEFLCPQSSHACMNLISPQEVLKRVERILEN